MRVLHLLSSDRISGAENVAADICMMFQGKIEMAYCSPEGSIRESMQKREVPFFPIESVTTSELKRVIRSYRPDLIHAHDIRATAIAALAAGRLPVVSHLHGSSERMRKVTAKSVVYLIASSRTKHIVTVSGDIMEEFAFSQSVYKKSTYLQNILYKPRLEKMITQDKAEYNFDFVYLGRICHVKNPERVARVAADVLKKVPDATFGVIGDGDMKEQMDTIFKEEGVADQVVFTGLLQLPYKALKQARCMLMCSRSEGTPIAALEALALGVPVISTPVGGMKEIIVNGENGYLSENDEKLSEEVTSLLLDDLKWRLLSEKTAQRFQLLNDEDDYLRRITEIYSRAGLQKASFRGERIG
ncbi:glycosyltransferase [Indiicoccus explosivorum]|uniref:glycosyltransferase n=1 Tax=Indiicoccus explosivorum TaxID=1917864 RepID=UPI001186DB1E|nr:glycosyltransferase [Indiicoccus explosivorum]